MGNSLFNHLGKLDGPLLVTGHTGFKGTWLIALLHELGISAEGIALPPERGSLYERGGFSGLIPEVYGDIRDQTFLRAQIERIKPSVILHMAAQPLVLKSYEDPIGTFETNVMGTANLLSSAIDCASVSAVGVVTTDKVYRNENHGKRFVEGDPLGGRDPYSASKVGTEAVVSAWCEISKAGRGMNLISLRAGNVIGGGDFAENRLFPDAVRAHLGDKKIEVRNPDHTRPWQHALDPLLGYLLALDSAINNRENAVYNFGPTESSMTVEEVLQVINEKWKLEVSFPLSTQKTHESKLLDLDPSKAMSELKWKPAFSQREAILSTVDWWNRKITGKETVKEICTSQIHQFLSIVS
jgi:CDP-glucose 4,6-dehydratase